MRRSLCSCLLLTFVTVVLAQDNPVVMRVADHDITRNEFEYFLQKNCVEDTLDFKTLSTYADLFVNFKLKVEAAKSEGIDTVTQFVKEYKSYRDIYADKLLIDTVWLENRAKSMYNDAYNAAGPKGYYEVSMITIAPKNDTEEGMEEAQERIFSIYEKIRNGEVSFGEMARQESDDNMADEGGYLGWIARNEVPEFMSGPLFESDPYTLMEPFNTPVGWLLLAIGAHKDFGSYEEHRDEIMDWMKDNGYIQRAKRSTANRYAKANDWTERGDSAVARLDSILEIIYPDFGNISREYYEGLLLFEISNRKIWSKVSSDTLALEKWFEEHSDEYSFDRRVFKGCLLLCASEEVLAEVKQYTEGVSVSDLKAKIEEYDPEHEKLMALYGPYKENASSYCDAIVFGKGSINVPPKFPCLGYIGKILDAPEKWTDMPGAVITDAQDAAEKAWIKELRKQYKVKLNKKELKSMCAAE